MSYPQYPNQQPYPSQQPYQQRSWQGEPPLWAPDYGAPFPAAVKRFFKKYATFSGGASRSEYWWWTLVSVIVSFILNIIISAGNAATATSSLSSSPQLGPGATFGLILAVIWGLATIVPSIALTVRRLHDSNKSGWLILLGLIPFAGAIILLVFALLGPDPAGQRFDQPTGY